DLTLALTGAALTGFGYSLVVILGSVSRPSGLCPRRTGGSLLAPTRRFSTWHLGSGRGSSPSKPGNTPHPLLSRNPARAARHDDLLPDLTDRIFRQQRDDRVLGAVPIGR